MSDLLIWAGNRMPISSGTLLTFGDQPTDFDIRINNDIARIRFEFPGDAFGMRTEYATAPPRPSLHGGTMPATITMRFFNLKSNTAFSDGPIRIGIVGGNAVWIGFEVSAAAGHRTMKKISYTVWEGPGSDKSGAPLVPGVAVD